MIDFIMVNQDLTDLVKKMEFGVEASVWEEDKKTTDNKGTNNSVLPDPMKNAPRNVKK